MLLALTHSDILQVLESGLDLELELLRIHCHVLVGELGSGDGELNPEHSIRVAGVSECVGILAVLGS